MGLDIRIRHGTTTTHAAHSSPQGSLGHDEHAQPGRAFLALAPSRAAAHLVITQKEIRCTRCHPKNKGTTKFVNPTRNNIMGSRNMKTCRRWAGGNFHLRAALDRVGTFTVFSGEDASGRRCCLRKNVSSQVMRNSSASTLARRSARPRSCASFHAFQIPLQRRGGRRNRLRVRLRSPHSGAGARRRSSHGDGGCRGLGRE